MSRSNRNCCTAAKLSNRAPAARRGGVEDVVDVGDVAAHLDVDARVPQHPCDEVSPDEGRGVPEVRRVVRRDPADVDPGPADDGHRGDRRGAARQAVGRALRRAARRSCRIRMLPGMATNRIPAIAASSSATPRREHALEGEERDLHRLAVLQDEHQSRSSRTRPTGSTRPTGPRCGSGGPCGRGGGAGRRGGAGRDECRTGRATRAGRDRHRMPVGCSAGTATRIPGSVTGSACGSTGPALPWAGTPPRRPRPASSVMSDVLFRCRSGGRDAGRRAASARAEPRPIRSRGRSG